MSFRCSIWLTICGVGICSVLAGISSCVGSRKLNRILAVQVSYKIFDNGAVYTALAVHGS